MISQIIYRYKQGNVNKQQLNSIMNEMIFDEYYSNILTPEDIEIFKTKYNEYFSKYIDKPWKDVLIDLLKEDNYKTWDNYALCVSLLFVLNNNESLKYNAPEYVKLIKEIVLSMPGERISIEETRTRLLEIAHVIPLVLPTEETKEENQEENQEETKEETKEQETKEETQEQETQEQETQEQETKEETQEQETKQEENQENQPENQEQEEETKEQK
jgi:hypothetical protein